MRRGGCRPGITRGDALYKTLKNENGAMLLTILVAVVAVGLAAGIAGTTWQTITQRSREADLLWRGDQYRKAIESYYLQSHGGAKLFPGSLDALIKDPRSLAPLRHIRQVYKDPMTGEDFVLVKQGGKILSITKPRARSWNLVSDTLLEESIE